MVLVEVLAQLADLLGTEAQHVEQRQKCADAQWVLVGGPDRGLDRFALCVDHESRRGVVVGVDRLQVTTLVCLHLHLRNFELTVAQAKILTRVLHVEICRFHIGVEVLLEGLE